MSAVTLPLLRFLGVCPQAEGCYKVLVGGSWICCKCGAM